MKEILLLDYNSRVATMIIEKNMQGRKIGKSSRDIGFHYQFYGSYN